MMSTHNDKIRAFAFRDLNQMLVHSTKAAGNNHADVRRPDCTIHRLASLPLDDGLHHRRIAGQLKLLASAQTDLLAYGPVDAGDDQLARTDRREFLEIIKRGQTASR